MLMFSLHALERLAKRGITRSEVLEALGNRETVYESAGERPALVVLGTTATGRRLKVAVDKDDESYVITVADRGSEE